MSRWLLAFVVTLAIELPIGIVVLGRAARMRRRISAILAANVLTHPLLWFVLPRLFSSYWTYVVVSEVGIVLVETVVLRLLARGATVRSCFAAAALANGASYLVGVLVRG